jgi:hypothetical protein
VPSGSPFNVAQGATATLAVQCSSAVAGTFNNASLDCSHNGGAAGNPSPASYPLACTVQAPGAAIYNSVPAPGSTIAMTAAGAVPVGTVVAPQTLMINNAANLATDNALGLEACAMDAGSTITATPTPLNANIAVDAVAQSVTFNCPTTTAGSFANTYRCPFSTNGVTGAEGTATYTVACNVRAPAALGRTNPANMTPLNIVVAAGGTENRTVTFSEINNEGVAITDLNCALTTAVDFTISSPASFPAIIPANGNLTLIVSFTDPANNTTPTDTLNCSFTDKNGANNVTFPLSSFVQAAPVANSGANIVIPAMNWIGYVLMALGLGLLSFRHSRQII